MTTKEEKGPCNQSRRSCSSHPAWLISTLSEMDERMKMLALNTSAKTRSREEGDASDTFAQRAESYYQKRPQLLSLLQDLYNAYLTLADRYSQTQTPTKHHRRQSSTQSQIHLQEEGAVPEEANSYDEEDYDNGTVSDVESSLSYQPHPPLLRVVHAKLDMEAMIVEVVMKNVECDILLDEMSMADQRSGESTRKIELQKSLLEVLESERMILLNENARLGYKVSALMEENKGLVSESLFMKRKAGELARCVLKMREDHRVCMLSRKIEDLQGQIYGLEKRNKEYYEQLMKKDQQMGQQPLKSKNKKKNNKLAGLDGCFQVHKLKTVENAEMNGKDGVKVFRWWERVKNLNVFICGPNTTCISSS